MVREGRERPIYWERAQERVDGGRASRAVQRVAAGCEEQVEMICLPTSSWLG